VKYAEKIATDLACGVFGVARGSVAWNAAVGAVKEVLKEAAAEARASMVMRSPYGTQQNIALNIEAMGSWEYSHVEARHKEID